MRVFKNYKSKKQLKLENAELKKQLCIMADTEKKRIGVTYCEIHKIHVRQIFEFYGWIKPPKDIYKEAVSRKLLEQLKPFIIWEEYETDDKRIQITAVLEVADRRCKHG